MSAPNSPPQEQKIDSKKEKKPHKERTTDRHPRPAALLAQGIDLLGLEDKHEQLYKSSALYRKISHAVIPPLRDSLWFLNAMGNDVSESEGDSAESDSLHEDVDVVVPLGERHGSTPLFSMLATTSSLHGNDSATIDHSVNERLPEDNDDTLLQQHSEELMPLDGISFHNGTTDGPTKPSKTVHAHQDQENNAFPYREVSSDFKNICSQALIAKAIESEEYRPPPQNLRTIWEDSVMKNSHIQRPESNLLIEVENTNEEAVENPQQRDVMSYHLAVTLRECFDFDDDNYLYDHYDVWLVKNVLVQGHLYITRDAICFYSLVPGEFSETELTDPELTIHAGTLGHKLAHYGDSYFTSIHTNRFWAVLKPQTLSIYTSPTKLYFPVRTIDLRNAISCEVCDSPATQVSPNHTPKRSITSPDSFSSMNNSETSTLSEEEFVEENVQTGVWFKIVCRNNKTYRFQTSSIYSARHWYNSITKAIFILQNTNESREVLIKLPIENITAYHRGVVLADSEDSETSSEDNIPMTFYFKFKLIAEEFESKLNKLKLSKGISEPKNAVDSAHFIAFRKGNTIFKTVERAVDEHLAKSSLNQKFKSKAKKFFRDDQSSEAKAMRVVTTVLPEFASGSSITDKIVNVNAQVQGIRRRDFSDFKEDFVGELNNLGHNGSSQRLSGVRKFLSVRNSYSSSSLSTKDAAQYPESSFDDLLPLPSFDNPSPHLQLPRPFSLSSLKNSDVQFLRRNRDFGDIVSQYGLLSEIVKRQQSQKKEKIFGREADSLDFLDEVSNSETGSDFNDSLRSSSTEEKIRYMSKKLTNLTSFWSSKPKHFELNFSDQRYYVKNQRERIKAVNSFRNHFSLGTDARLLALCYSYMRRSVPVFGKLYIGKDQLCFRSVVIGVSTKMVLPLKDIEQCQQLGRSHYFYRLSVKAKNSHDMVLEFGSKIVSKDCYRMIIKALRIKRSSVIDNEFKLLDDSSSSIGSNNEEEQTRRTNQVAKSRVESARLRLLEDKIAAASGIDMPLILENNPFTPIEVKMAKSYRFTFLTIGSRGDVQPYIALGKGLRAEGHSVTIATHSEFKDWILSHDLNFKEIAGNPAELMSLMVTYGSISVGFLREASTKFRSWISELLVTSWEACKETDILIESPSSMAGLHIAEALNIPYMRAFTMPWTRTRAYPHAFVVPEQKRGGSYNFLTHVMFENIFWKGISGQINKWRVETLGLSKTSLEKMHQTRIPFLYNVSPAIFPPSVDFQDWVKVTGYWFLDEGSQNYKPPQKLQEFLEEAKKNSEKVVYIGFGSIVVSDPKVLTKTIVDAVIESGVKCILNRGWSDRSNKSDGETQLEFPPQIYDAGSVPHDWLFPRCDAVVHHGGSGTTGASLRAGSPTIIKPFFGDQFFYASRIEDLGVGIALKSLNKKSLTKALKAVTSEAFYLEKAQNIAKAMKHERGVLSAIEAIYTELAYAKSLMSGIRNHMELKKSPDDKSGIQTPVVDQEAMEIANELENDEQKSEYDGYVTDSDSQPSTNDCV